MIIPTQLKIGAHLVKIREAEFADDVRCCGDTSYVGNEIRINQALPQSQKEATLIHEIFHVLNTTLNHELLDSLSEQFYQVLHDNDLLK